jgi:hypothetical protein
MKASAKEKKNTARPMKLVSCSLTPLLCAIFEESGILFLPQIFTEQKQFLHNVVKKMHTHTNIDEGSREERRVEKEQ